MHPIMANLVCAARQGDADEWMQLLVLVLLAVFYVLGSIIKAAANRRRQQQTQQGDSTLESLLRMPPKPTPVPKVRDHQMVTMQPTVTPPSPPAPRPATKPSPTSPKFPVIASQPSVRKTSYPQQITKPRKPGKKQLSISSQPDRRPLNLDNPENLRRAILYAEIIGKPVSMRPPKQ